jgi:hypothetical protein
VIVPSNAEMDGLRKTFRPQHEEWIKSRANGRRVYDALQKILVETRARS